MAIKRKRKTDGASKLQRAKAKVVDAGESFEYLKMLVYGKNGVGKTRFAATGPKPLIIDCNEKGTLSIRKFPDVKIFPLEMWTDIDLAYWYLHKGDHGHETVVIDTVSSLATLCMSFVLGDEASRDPTMDPTMPSKREWGKVAQLMKTEILKFRNLPMHVIFVAQERRGFTEDEDDEAPEIFPEVSPAVRTTLTAAVDIIGRMYVREVAVKGKGGKKETRTDYRMLTGASERYVTKDRSEADLPRVIRLSSEKDNLDKLVERIRASE